MATKKKIITEKELLSMSEDEYMNEDQLAFFRARLEAMEAQLRHNAGQTTETLRQTQLAPDPLDRATIEERRPPPSRALQPLLPSIVFSSVSSSPSFRCCFSPAG